jgi:hypothetical protein
MSTRIGLFCNDLRRKSPPRNQLEPSIAHNLDQTILNASENSDFFSNKADFQAEFRISPTARFLK